jgi:integrase
MGTRRRPRGTGTKYRRGKIWYIKYHHRGEQIRECTHSTDEREAEKLLRKRLTALDEGAKPATHSSRATISKIIDLTLNEYRLMKRRGLKIEELRSKAPKRLVGDVLASKFGKAHVQEYIEARRHEGRADSTINREFSLIRHGFTLARQTDPPLIDRVPHIPKLEEDNVRQGFLEHPEYLNLREALPPHLKCLLVCGYYLGIRLGVFRRMKWSQVDLAAAEIRIAKRQAKSKKPHTAPIYGEMKTWLDMQFAEHQQLRPDCEYVFNYHGRPIGHHVGGWREACIAVGMPELYFHDLRRSAVRNMERAGIPRKVAMSITGHLTETMYGRYDIVNDRDVRQAARRMEQFFEEAKAVEAADPKKRDGSVQ